VKGLFLGGLLLPKLNIGRFLALDTMGASAVAVSLQQLFLFNAGLDLEVVDVLSHVHQQNFLVL
jgi:hypothetical protein